LYEGENGVEGLAIAAKEMPDLIVLDITMPVMTGIENARQA
jgi:two-component system cell cycle response regulator